ncbi:MAG: helix-turn-helix transcriptional regulator, partial [Syntrophorhabdaceae bacterium]|nr:helix-turn-helix transcriptional regulator [Syntrophorhabdaceae bacterium]
TNMEILSTKELAKYIKINEKKIYKLVQEGKIPHAKIGGKIAFTKELIDRWILENTEMERHILIAGSDDVLLRKIIDIYNGEHPSKIFYAPVGSINGLKLLEQKGATIACVHIIDIEKRQYVASYINRYLTKNDYVVVRLFSRQQGLYVKKGNPKGIKGIKDLIRDDVVFVNRNKGSGTRLLLDFLLNEAGIETNMMHGYNNEVGSHLECGLSVLKGNADAAFGIEYIAHVLNLDFIFLMNEKFDMVIPKDYYHSQIIKDFLAFFDQSKLINKIKDFAGYSLEEMGSIVYP